MNLLFGIVVIIVVIAAGVGLARFNWRYQNKMFNQLNESDAGKLKKGIGTGFFIADQFQTFTRAAVIIIGGIVLIGIIIAAALHLL
ncbi:MAG: hypothetical protein KGI73_00395 [Patescibacteria group bacterium]|nr:hypothetical protein [Patescibacteria group bacterium]